MDWHDRNHHTSSSHNQYSLALHLVPSKQQEEQASKLFYTRNILRHGRLSLWYMMHKWAGRNCTGYYTNSTHLFRIGFGCCMPRSGHNKRCYTTCTNTWCNLLDCLFVCRKGHNCNKRCSTNNSHRIHKWFYSSICCTDIGQKAPQRKAGKQMPQR